MTANVISMAEFQRRRAEREASARDAPVPPAGATPVIAWGVPYGYGWVLVWMPAWVTTRPA